MKLFFLVFVSLVGYVQIGHALSSQEVYDRIDAHLVGTVPTDDVETNMDEAERWAASLVKDHVNHGELIDFLRLRDLTKSCDVSGLRVVELNNAGARLGSMPIKNPKRRVEKIVYHYSKQHYEMCYPDKVAAKFNQLEPVTQKLLMNLGSSNLATRKELMAIDLIRLVRENIGLGVGIGKAVMEKYSNHEVTEFDLRKYVVLPCKELASKLGQDFSKHTLRDFEYYDISPDQVLESVTRHRAVRNCQTILKLEGEIYPSMVELMVRGAERMSV